MPKKTCGELLLQETVWALSDTQRPLRQVCIIKS